MKFTKKVDSKISFINKYNKIYLLIVKIVNFKYLINLFNKK